MSSLQLQNMLYKVLPQLNEGQLRKVVAYIQSLLAAQKLMPAPHPAAGNKRELRVIADESFDLEMAEIHVALPFSKTFQVKTKVVAVEKLKPSVILP